MKHELKYCLRCEESFECKVNNVLHCQCSEVQINPKTVAFLAETDYDCLCQKCLIEINKLVLVSGQTPFPRKNHEFIEGLHYYLENGYWVFTEFYHLSRGSCCGNNCRHCAYGNKKSDS